MSIPDAIGVLGVLMYLVTYFLLQIEKLQYDDYYYLLINIVAALFIIFSLISEFNLSAFLIEVAWILISVMGMIRRWQNDRRTSSSSSPSDCEVN